jgi:membrane protease YdiL (CAAX protease family)
MTSHPDETNVPGKSGDPGEPVTSPADVSSAGTPPAGTPLQGALAPGASLEGAPESNAPPEVPRIEAPQPESPQRGALPSHAPSPEAIEPSVATAVPDLAGGGDSPPPWRTEPPASWRDQPPAVPPDLRVPWGAREVVLFLLFAALLILVATLAVSLGLRALGVTHGFGPRGPRETSIFLLANQAILFAGIMLYLYWRIHWRYGAPFWSTLQWKPLEPLRAPRWLAYLGCVGGGCTLAVVIEAASQHLGKNANMPIETFFKTRDTALVLLVMSVLMAPLLEETIFRGLLYPVLARAWGIAWGIVVTGILFGLMHSQQLGGSKAHVALLILVGITLTWVRAGTRSVLASFLVHISYNGFLTAGFIASGAFRHLPPR